jgi:uncharacterized protein (TIGR00369 family)
MTAPEPDIPEGFKPRRFGDGFIAVNGPLYVKKLERGILLGFRVEPRHCNPMGICHGGMISTFCDMLLPISAHYLSADVARRFLPTINLQVDFLAPSPNGAWVQGEAQLLRATRSMVFMQGLVTADGQSVARVSGIFKIGPRFEDAPPAPPA